MLPRIPGGVRGDDNEAILLVFKKRSLTTEYEMSVLLANTRNLQNIIQNIKKL